MIFSRRQHFVQKRVYRRVLRSRFHKQNILVKSFIILIRCISQSFVMKHGPSIIHKKKRIDKMKAFMSFLILLQSSIVTFLYLLFQILYSASFFIHSSETNIRRSTEYHQKNVFVDIDYLKYLQASSINPNVRAKRISFRKFGNWEKFIFN